MTSTMQAKAAAEYVGVSYWKLLELVKAGEIPHIRLGRRILFRRETLDKWLADQEAASLTEEESASGKIRKLQP